MVIANWTLNYLGYVTEQYCYGKHIALEKKRVFIVCGLLGVSLVIEPDSSKNTPTHTIKPCLLSKST